jgi:hypothetical protein
MDPNLFHIDWERTGEVLTTIVVLSFVVERSLALLFENKWFVERFDDSGIKEPISFGVSALVCWKWDFDAVSMIILTDKTRFLGFFITAAVIAGGSKASIKLFHDVLGVQSTASKEAKARRGAKEPAKVAPAPPPAPPPASAATGLRL